MASKDSDDRTESGRGRSPSPADRSPADLAASNKADDRAHPESVGPSEGPSSDQLSYTPKQIGPYLLRETLGEGGMGVVYGAEQIEPVRREVALKVIKLGMDTKEVVARFEAERQALAVMEHPSIAKVFDAGATDTGQPYFVMELVRGISIIDYCDQHRLTVRERVRLFVQACLAVQHAHQKGVIHRDLKPSNILITEADGKPLAKIIDFGIAKATGRPLTDQPIETDAEQVMGTPAYTSPEQAGVAGVDVDTRTDVYSLGVTLYELLTGALPFESEAYVGLVRLATALEREPPTPSRRLVDLGVTKVGVAGHRRTDAATLARELRGDLDWIVMKAIAKDRSHRYETAESLAMELLRYLDDQPVLARAPSTQYRMGKFVRRHKVGVAFAATLGVLLVGVTINQTIQAERIRLARDLADTRRGQAEGLIDFMLGDLREKLAPIGRLEILGDVGDQAMRYFAAIPEEEYSDPELSSRSQALYQIGQVRLDEGNPGEAIALFRESLRLAQELSARDPGNVERLFGLSQSQFWLGNAFFIQGELDGAQEHFEAYREVSERLVSEHPENLDYQLELGYSYTNIGAVFQERGNLDGAAEQFTKSLEVKQTLAGREPDSSPRQLDLANSYNTVGVVLGELGELRSALDHLISDVSIMESLTQLEPSNMVFRSELVTSRASLGLAFAALGQLDPAIFQSRDALRLARSLVVHDPENARWRREVAVGEARVARLVLETGNFGEARDFLGSAQRALAGLAAANPTEMVLSQDLAGARALLGRAHLGSGDLREALAVAQNGLAELERENPPPLDRMTILRLAQLHLVEAETLERLGEGTGVRAVLEESDRLLGPLAAESRDWRYLDEWARVLVLLGRRDAAERVVDELISYGYGRPSFLAFLDQHDFRYGRPAGTL